MHPASSTAAGCLLRVLVDIGGAAFTVHVHDVTLPKSFILCEALRRYASTHGGAHPDADALYSQWRCELIELSHEIGNGIADGERSVMAERLGPTSLPTSPTRWHVAQCFANTSSPLAVFPSTAKLSR